MPPNPGRLDPGATVVFELACALATAHVNKHAKSAISVLQRIQS
jgi:hypothetical protein